MLYKAYYVLKTTLREAKKNPTDNLFPTLQKHIEKAFLEQARYRTTVVY